MHRLCLALLALLLATPARAEGCSVLGNSCRQIRSTRLSLTTQPEVLRKRAAIFMLEMPARIDGHTARQLLQAQPQQVAGTRVGLKDFRMGAMYHDAGGYVFDQVEVVGGWITRYLVEEDTGCFRHGRLINAFMGAGDLKDPIRYRFLLER